jgi:hypothetical protein
MQDRIRILLNSVGGAKPLLEFTSRSKIAGKSGAPAIDSFSVDRRSDRVVCTHWVQEMDDRGVWMTVHKHEKL